MPELKCTHLGAIALSIGCLAATAPAQQPADGCGTQLTPNAVRQALRDVDAGAYRLTAEQQQTWQQRGVTVIPVTIHDVRPFRGLLGFGATPQIQIDQMFIDANAMWAPANIQFCQYGATRVILSDEYFDLDPAVQDNLRQVDRVENTINVYLVDEFGPWCGTGSYTSSPFQGIIMDKDCIGFGDPVTFAHELGHFFNLFHTHETAIGVECVNGSNCATAGDLICDTPADPLLTGKVGLDCGYNGTDTDSCNGDVYAPDVTNIMSYSRRSCMNTFSPMQIARAQATLINLRPELLNNLCTLDDTCGSGAGDCLTPNGTPGCATDDCCALVCAVDPFCCDTEWDAICADAALTSCGVAGDEWDCASPVTEGTYTPDLSNNTSGLTDDTSCGAGDGLDEWYAYTASCNGTATASICTEFSSVDITLAVFDDCDGFEVACSADHSDCVFGADDSADISWTVSAGQTYLIRVSGEGASQTTNFVGDLVINCDGCGEPASGSCFANNGTPNCDDPLCCETVCAIDPFCCNTEWDQICADLAATNCGDCGAPGAGSCFIANGTPYCDRPACCDAVCSIDPFCCDTVWDDLCAQQALTLGGSCIVIPMLDVPHVPIGSAVISTLPGGGIMIEDFDNPEEGDGVRVDLDGSASSEAIAFEDITYAGSLTGGVAVQVGVLDVLALDSPFIVDERLSMTSLTGIRAGVAVNSEINGAPAQSRVIALNDDAVAAIGAFTATRGSGELIATGDADVQPSAAGGERRGPEYAVWMEWDQPQSFSILSLPAVQADTIVVVTRNDDGPIDPNDAPPARSDRGAGPTDPTPLASVFLLGADDLESLDSISVARERADVPGPWCRADLDFSITVDVFDLLELLSAWGPCDGCAADFDDSGAVNVFDLLEILGSWGDCP